MNEYEKHAMPAAHRQGFNDALDGRKATKHCWPAEIMPHYHEGYRQGRIAAAAPAMLAALEGALQWLGKAMADADQSEPKYIKTGRERAYNAMQIAINEARIDGDAAAQAAQLRADALALDTGMDPALVRELHAEADRLEGGAA